MSKAIAIGLVILWVMGEIGGSATILPYYQVSVRPLAGQALRVEVKTMGNVPQAKAVAINMKDVAWIGPCKNLIGSSVRYPVPVLPSKEGRNNLGTLKWYSKCGGNVLGETSINVYFAESTSTLAGSLFKGAFGLRTSFGAGTLPRATRVVFTYTKVNLNGCKRDAIAVWAQPGVLPNSPGITIQMVIGSFDNDGVIWRLSPIGSWVQLPTLHRFLNTVLETTSKQWGTFAIHDPDNCPS